MRDFFLPGKDGPVVEVDEGKERSEEFRTYNWKEHVPMQDALHAAGFKNAQMGKSKEAENLLLLLVYVRFMAITFLNEINGRWGVESPKQHVKKMLIKGQLDKDLVLHFKVPRKYHFFTLV